MAEAVKDDPAAWWDFDANDAPKSWRPEGTPILNALMQHVPMATDRRPWQEGHELHMQGLGGLVSKERRHFTILGHGDYSNHIGGCRKLVANTQSMRTQKHLTVSVAKGKSAPDVDAPWGRDSLTVDGDAEMTFGSRTLMMAGFVTRNWNGGVMRLASMEGVICGGAFLRLIASPSATLSGLMTGDVYGGCARAASVRTYLAVLHYRAAATAAWASGVYVRNTTFTIDPVTNVPTQGLPMTDIGKILARLGKMLEIARMLCPVLDIFLGLVMLIPMGIYALAALIAGIVKSPNPLPPAGPPRLRTMNVGTHLEDCGAFLAV